MKYTKGFTLIEGLIVSAFGGIVLFLIVGAINRVGIESKAYPGKVSDMNYREAYATSSTTIIDGRHHTTITNHPARWTVYVSYNEVDLRCSTTSGKYDSLNIGDAVSVYIGSGRLFGDDICTKIDLLLG